MAARFEVHDSSNGQFYALFRAANGEKVWWTETYQRKESAIAACNLIKREGPTAQIYDHTRSARAYR